MLARRRPGRALRATPRLLRRRQRAGLAGGGAAGRARVCARAQRRAQTPAPAQPPTRHTPATRPSSAARPARRPTPTRSQRPSPPARRRPVDVSAAAVASPVVMPAVFSAATPAVAATSAARTGPRCAQCGRRPLALALARKGGGSSMPASAETAGGSAGRSPCRTCWRRSGASRRRRRAPRRRRRRRRRGRRRFRPRHARAEPPANPAKPRPAVPPASAAELARWGLARVDFCDDDDEADDDLFCACGKVHPPTWRHSLADPTGPPLPPLGPPAAEGPGGPQARGPAGRPRPAGRPDGGGRRTAKVQGTDSYEGSLRGTASEGAAAGRRRRGRKASAVLPAGARRSPKLSSSFGLAVPSRAENSRYSRLRLQRTSCML